MPGFWAGTCVVGDSHFMVEERFSVGRGHCSGPLEWFEQFYGSKPNPPLFRLPFHRRPRRQLPADSSQQEAANVAVCSTADSFQCWDYSETKKTGQAGGS